MNEEQIIAAAKQIDQEVMWVLFDDSDDTLHPLTVEQYAAIIRKCLGTPTA